MSRTEKFKMDRNICGYYKRSQLVAVGGCDLQLLDNKIYLKKFKTVYVPFECATFMHLPNSRVLCSYVSEEPMHEVWAK